MACSLESAAARLEAAGDERLRLEEQRRSYSLMAAYIQHADCHIAGKFGDETALFKV